MAHRPEVIVMQAGAEINDHAARALYQKPNGDMADCSRPVLVKQKHSFTEKIWRLPDYLGAGMFRRMEFDSRLHITTSECHLKNNLVAEVSDSTRYVYLTSCLKGFQKCKNISIKNKYNIIGGKSFLHFSPDPLIIREVNPGQTLQTVLIKIPLEMALDMFENKQLEKAISDNIPLICEQNLYPSMLAPLLQIYSCHFQGTARRFFIEGLMLEFIARWIDGQSNSTSAKRPHLKPDETYRIWKAHEILLKDICNPPSLMSLAASVGLTHTRLNFGFRSIFGSTVYEYLRAQRLEMAHLLVLEGSKSITEIAYETGFASGSHFTHAFRKHFGVTPSRYK